MKNLKEGNQTKQKKVKEEREVPKFVSKGLKTISDYFGHKIDVKLAGNDKGKIIIPFHSEEDFNRIKKLLQ